jgi:hypothetical protein
MGRGQVRLPAREEGLAGPELLGRPARRLGRLRRSYSRSSTSSSQACRGGPGGHFGASVYRKGALFERPVLCPVSVHGGLLSTLPSERPRLESLAAVRHIDLLVIRPHNVHAILDQQVARARRGGAQSLTAPACRSMGALDGRDESTRLISLVDVKTVATNLAVDASLVSDVTTAAERACVAPGRHRCLLFDVGCVDLDLFVNVDLLELEAMGRGAHGREPAYNEQSTMQRRPILPGVLVAGIARGSAALRRAPRETSRAGLAARPKASTSSRAALGAA